MIKLIAVGDINLGNDKKAIQDIRYNESLQDIFKKADLVFANLEGPITNAGAEPVNGDFGLYSEFGTIKFLKNYGINLVSLANNHMGDYGPLSVEFTIDFLNENGIRHFGWGKNINEVLYPKIITVNGIRIGLIALTFHDGRNAENYIPGMVPPEEPYYLPLLKKTRDESDFVIVSLHWGFEMYPYPQPKDKDLAHKLIDQGADLVLGHHPHVVQGHETYNGKHIFYSLGNFVFKSYYYKGNKQKQAEESKQTMFVSIDIDSSGIHSFEYLPVYYNEDLSIQLVEGEKKDKFLAYYKNISDILVSKKYNSVFRKFRLSFEFPLKQKMTAIFRKEGLSFSLPLRLLKFLVKFFKIGLLRK